MLDHPDSTTPYDLPKEALGTVNYHFVGGLLTQPVDAQPNDDKIDEGELNLSAHRAIEWMIYGQF